MRGQLLESKVCQGGFTGGTLASIALHAGMVSFAVLVTAQTHSTRIRPAPEVVRWVEPPLPQAPPVAERAPARRPAIASQSPALRPPAAIDVVIPAIEPRALTPTAAEPAQSAATATGRESASGIAPALAVPDFGSVFDASQVEREVRLRSLVSPRYPAALQYAGTEGRVVAQFVVDEEGRADVSTFRIIDSAHDLFSRAVRDVLPQLRFTPAEIGGRRVAQLVQMPFDFRISH